MWGRPNLHTSYQSEMSIFPTWTQRILITLLGLLAVLLAFDLPVINQIPVVSYLGDDDWIRLTTQAVIFVDCRARAEPAHRSLRPGLTRPRLLHGCRRVHGRLPRR